MTFSPSRAFTLAALGAPALLLSACVSVQTPAGDAAMPGGGVCNAQPAQRYVGQALSDSIGGDILAASGARTLRWGGPDTAWTMDFREDRVGVRYDERRVITQIACG